MGVDHPDTLISVNSLGGLLEKQGKLEEAEVLYRRSLEGRERVLGVDHPNTLTSVNNLGVLLEDQGKLEEAEVLYRRALEGRERVLGVDAPETLRSVNNLGTLLEAQGKLEEAEVLSRRARLNKTKSMFSKKGTPAEREAAVAARRELARTSVRTIGRTCMPATGCMPSRTFQTTRNTAFNEEFPGARNGVPYTELPSNKKRPLSPHAVSYTHLTLPTIYSV